MLTLPLSKFLFLTGCSVSVKMGGSKVLSAESTGKETEHDGYLSFGIFAHDGKARAHWMAGAEEKTERCLFCRGMSLGAFYNRVLLCMEKQRWV